MSGAPGREPVATVAPADVLAFWRAAGPDKWFEQDAELDSAIAGRFFRVWQEAAAGRLAEWEQTPESALALVIVLDQFPRNMFRGDARSFATDGPARAAAPARPPSRRHASARAEC